MSKELGRGRKQSLEEFAARLNVSFTDWQLLQQALTHTSYANEVKRAHTLHNERLEFLGDAVLELVISTYLYKQFPHLPEGELTKARASIVCESTLAKRAAALDVGEYLLFGKGELTTGGKERASILADAFEAIIGAVYMDHDIAYASAYVLAQLEGDLASLAMGHCMQDYKTFLQEVIQKNVNQTISYELLSETGPDHEKLFRIAVVINAQQCGIGEGKSKKEAEQRAAQEALRKMNVQTNL